MRWVRTRLTPQAAQALVSQHFNYAAPLTPMCV